MSRTRGVTAGPNKPIFDTKKARAAIESGRRAKWWRRKGTMKSGFSYIEAAGGRVTDTDHLERIRLLVIPPAWKHVRISPTPGGRIQAIGMDTTGRVQYRYSSKFAEKQQRTKFAKIEKFGEYLPKLREVTNANIALDGFPREKVLAIIMRLINSLYIRIGTEKSERHYKTYGITTLNNKHLTIGKKGELIFEFVGKSHIKHRKVLVDEELAAVLADLKQLGGARRLFHYVDDQGKPRPVRPAEINAYIKTATAPEFSSKDFRTWGGTLLAAVKLAELGPACDEPNCKKNTVRAVKQVAEHLGNTPAVCRSSYIHPAVISAYERGITIDEFTSKKARRIRRIEGEYEPEERALIKLLQNGRKK